MDKMAGVSIIVFWAITVIWICSANGQGCDRFNSLRIPEAEPSSILEVDYFSCADGEFLTSVEVWYDTEVGELRWNCSDGKASYYPEDFVFDLNYSLVTFDVGITTVETRFDATFYQGSSDTIVFFVDCYIGGYDFSSTASTSDRGIFSWSGPFGREENYTEEKWTSSCPDYSFATGVTWWTPETYNFVNGIQLECADVTSTCYPPAFKNQGDTTDYIDSTETDDNSSEIEMGTIIAAAIGSAVAVVLAAVAIGLCFVRSRRRKTARGQETEVSPPLEKGNSRAPPRPHAVPRSFEPRARVPQPVHAEAPPAYKSPPAYMSPPSYESPPPYVFPGNAGDAY